MNTRMALIGFVLATAAFAGERIPDEKLKAILNEGLGTTLVVVADTSGSMRDRPAAGGDLPKIDIARGAVSSFIRTLPADVKLGMITFNGCAPRWVAELGKSKQQDVAQTATQIQARGSTPIAFSLDLAFEGLKPVREKNPYERCVVVLITDGEETCAPVENVSIAAEKLANAGIELQVIGFDLPSQDTVLKKIGTKYYLASDSKELEAGLQSVQGELELDGNVDTIGAPAAAGSNGNSGSW